jgi:hypothetical protein
VSRLHENLHQTVAVVDIHLVEFDTRTFFMYHVVVICRPLCVVPRITAHLSAVFYMLVITRITMGGRCELYSGSSCLHICFINMIATTNMIHGYFYFPVVRTLRDICWVWGGHEQLCCTLSQNVYPPQQHYSYIQCSALLETVGVHFIWSRNRQSAHAQYDYALSPASTSQQIALAVWIVRHLFVSLFCLCKPLLVHMNISVLCVSSGMK